MAPNRFERVRRVLIWESVAREAMEKAAAERAELDAAARKELEDEGTAPTWRIPDVGTVSLPVSVEKPFVADEAAFLEWVRKAAEDEVEHIERVRPAFAAVVLQRVDAVTDYCIDPDTGEVIPGLGVRPGGHPQPLRFLPSKDAKAVAAAGAKALLDDVEKRIGGPVVLAERSDD